MISFINAYYLGNSLRTENRPANLQRNAVHNLSVPTTNIRSNTTYQRTMFRDSSV